MSDEKAGGGKYYWNFTGHSSPQTPTRPSEPREYPSAEALAYGHDVRWPNDRIDLARLCEGFAAQREAAAPLHVDEADRRYLAKLQTNEAWKANQFHASDIAFLVCLLKSALKPAQHEAALIERAERVGRGLELNDCAVFLEGYATDGPPGWRPAAACFAHHIRQGAHRKDHSANG